MGYTRTELHTEGKTKRNWNVAESTRILDVENKNAITAFDNPAFTKEFKTKGVCSTAVTSRVFEMLRAKGIPVAFIQRTSDSSFAAPKCRMIPLEIVGRRFAVGSYLKRQPEFKKPDGEVPHRFDEVVFELFLKTTKGSLVTPEELVLVEGLDPLKGEEDPFIPNPMDEEWKLFHPKTPPDQADLGKRVLAKDVLPEGVTVERINKILVDTFLAIEEEWTKLGFHFIDIKIELGVDEYGNLLVADVIDNDSWRLRTNDWKELSKEAFRQGEELSEVEKKYLQVADLVEKFLR